MTKTNCPNCGAPLETQNNKCSYCGTPYFDMSIIEANGDPFILQLKYNNEILALKARLTNLMIEHNTRFNNLYCDNQIVASSPVYDTEVSLNFISCDPPCKAHI